MVVFVSIVLIFIAGRNSNMHKSGPQEKRRSYLEGLILKDLSVHNITAFRHTIRQLFQG